MAIDEAVWAKYRAWCLSNDHALSTTAKSSRYLRYLESEKGIELDSFDRERVIELLAQGREAGMKPVTLNSWIRELNLWLRFRDAGWKIPYFRNRNRPVVRVPDRPIVRQLLDLRWPNPSTSARNRAILAVLSDVGPRRSEIVAMNLQDRTQADDGTPVLMVRHGKGDKERPLWIDRRTDELLETYVNGYRIASDSLALFTTSSGRMSDGYLAQIVVRAGRRVGAPWLSPHKLRHYTCDSLLDAGVSVPSVAELLGHADLRTTALYRSKRLAKARAEQEVRAASKARFGGKL